MHPFLCWLPKCLHWPFCPGVFIAILAVVAGAVTFWEHPPRWVKAISIFVFLALMCSEVWMMSKDRERNDSDQTAARTASENNFREIAGEITASIAASDRNFAATMRKSDTITSGVADSIRTQTGGDSFAYITLTAQAGYLHFEEKDPICQQSSGSAERDPAGPYFQVAITSHGKYPLRELHATMMDDERRLAAVAEYNKHPKGDWIKAISSSDTEYRCLYLKPQSPEGPSGDVEMLGTYPLPMDDSKRLSIAFRSLNGYWDETLHLGLVNGKWRQCLSIMGPTAKQATNPFIYCDSDWPEGRALAEKDWEQSNPKH
jgi:hypothetical protein